MKKEYYDACMQSAMRSLIKSAMEKLRVTGQNPDLLLTFITNHSDVKLPESVKVKYPLQMSIILQHQFKNLTISEEAFSVTLSFDGIEQRITVPFDAIVYFLDKECDFAMQLNYDRKDGGYDRDNTRLNNKDSKIIDLADRFKKPSQ